MSLIGGAILKTYYVNVQFRDTRSGKFKDPITGRKKRGQLVVVEFGQDAIQAEAFAHMIRYSKFKDITYIWTWVVA